jgi:hypothetical protein
MDFPINAKAEGRVLVPWEENLYSNLTADSSRESLSRWLVIAKLMVSRYRECPGWRVYS